MLGCLSGGGSGLGGGIGECPLPLDVVGITSLGLGAQGRGRNRAAIDEYTYLDSTILNQVVCGLQPTLFLNIGASSVTKDDSATHFNPL